MDTKANINLKEGTVELIGSEEFVSKYLDIFKEFFSTQNHQHPKQNKDESNGGDVTETFRTNGKEKKEKRTGKPAKAKNISIEKFDLHKDKDNPSLEDFLKDKNPGKTTANIIAVIAYYITMIKGIEYFSEGNIDYAYRTLSIPGRPNHLRQIIINAKNDKDFFEAGEEGKWKLTRTGEIFVDEKLPPKN
jgi:hypothetical protein